MQRRVSCILALSLRRGQVKSLQAARQKTARSLLQQDMGHRWFPEPSGGGTDQWIASNFKAEVNLTTNQACHFEQRILFNLRLSLWQTKKKRKKSVKKVMEAFECHGQMVRFTMNTLWQILKVKEWSVCTVSLPPWTVSHNIVLKTKCNIRKVDKFCDKAHDLLQSTFKAIMRLFKWGIKTQLVSLSSILIIISVNGLWDVGEVQKYMEE